MRQDPLAQIRMRWIRPGRYLRGGGEDDAEARDNEKPQHEVLLTYGFWLSDAPVTQSLWMAVMGENPSHFEGAAHPVERVSWEDCQRFCARLSRLCPGLHPRLPTEAEWEYAARAGTPTPRYGELDDIAWYYNNSGRQTYPVRQKQPNAWGLYDMLGSVWEWCQDSWDYGKPYPADVEPQVDHHRTEGSRRVHRGGCWSSFARNVRAAVRGGNDPGYHYHILGFRFAGGRGPRIGVPGRGWVEPSLVESCD